jgi:antitoxin (DNA-binding transcriptional repressor) of toxin-antitoxin stability system
MTARAARKTSRIGIRQLKAELSRQLRRVEAGETLAVTDRDRVIATINPVAKDDEHPATQGAREMVAAGRASWSGRKLTVPKQAARLRGHATVSDAVIEDRR